MQQGNDSLSERDLMQSDSHVILPSSPQVIAVWPFYTGIGGYWPLPSHTY